MTQFLNFRTLNISQTDKVTLFEFGTQTDTGQFLPVEHKSARKWGGIGHVTQFHNLIWDPSLFRERMNICASNLVHRYIVGPSFIWMVSNAGSLKISNTHDTKYN